MSCKFIGQLSRLRKLSAESVENTNTFDLFKEYLHVERQVEIELRDLLRNINANQEKCLVLLCGSAGDGKSHLISYLKNSDDEGLLNNFEPYNDATESSEPTLTSIDTLAEKLSSFNDDNLDSNDGKKMIIAINLGTLNNFIDSEKGKNFRKLKHYVLNNGIFSGYGQSGGYQVGSVFQHVSFSDYQVFSLGSNGIETTFLDLLFKKVFQKESNNPFYTSYEECGKCPMSARCPVRHNYEFLSEISNQKSRMDSITTGIALNGLISGTPSVLNAEWYKTGFGTKYARKNQLTRMAAYYNAMYRVAFSGSSYEPSSCIFTEIEQGQEGQLGKIYSSSNWVVFVDPKVDLSFFQKQKSSDDELMIIHYSDQYTSASGYDDITVTQKSNQYNEIIFDQLQKKGVTADAENIHDIISLFIMNKISELLYPHIYK